MASCLVYFQLFAGWLLLNLSTFTLVTIPRSTQLIGIAEHISDEDALVVYGLWVLVEIGMFFLLLVTATVTMCTCTKLPAGSGFIHLLVDPCFVTLFCIPFVVIRGLPSVQEAQHCLHAWQRLYYTQTGDANQAVAQISGSISSLTASTVGKDSSLLEANSSIVRRQCLFMNNHRNVSALYSSPGAVDSEIEEIHSLQVTVSRWIMTLQCAVVLPVLLRVLHFRWKMSWQPFLQSNLYIFIQAMDIVHMLESCIQQTEYAWSIALRCVVSLALLFTTINSVTLSIPPVYLGNNVTKPYMKKLLYVGVLAVDLPFLISRFSLAGENVLFPHLLFTAGFYIMLMKNLLFVVGLACLSCQRLTRCVGYTYLNLNMLDSDMDDTCGQEMEAYL